MVMLDIKFKTHLDPPYCFTWIYFMAQTDKPTQLTSRGADQKSHKGTLKAIQNEHYHNQKRKI